MKYIIPILIVISVAVAQMPTDPGPYEVGCRIRTIERPSDTDTTTRVMDIYIWYPADPIIGFWVEAIEAYLNERPMQGDTARPVLFFSHGGCGHPLAAVYFTSFMPSWGFTVVSTMHPGSMYGEADCLDSASLHDTWLNRPGDIEFTRRHFIDLAADSANLFGVLDTSRMGMSGHSFGARTTYAMLNRSDYFLCGLAFSGNYVERFGAPMNCMEDIRGIHQPIMIQNGTYDWGLPNEYAREIYDTLDSPKYWAEIHRVGHFQWGDTCDPAMDPQCGVDSMLDYATAHFEILKYGVPFLMHYVMGDSRFDSYLVDTSDTFVTYIFDDGMAIAESGLPRYIDISVMPNPFNSACRIMWERASALDNRDRKVSPTVEIFDINGRMVEPVTELVEVPGGAKLPSTGSGSGISEFIWQPDKSLGSGIYLVRVKGTDSTAKIIYMK